VKLYRFPIDRIEQTCVARAMSNDLRLLAPTAMPREWPAALVACLLDHAPGGPPANTRVFTPFPGPSFGCRPPAIQFPHGRPILSCAEIVRKFRGLGTSGVVRAPDRALYKGDLWAFCACIAGSHRCGRKRLVSADIASVRCAQSFHSKLIQRHLPRKEFLDRQFIAITCFNETEQSTTHSHNDFRLFASDPSSTVGQRQIGHREDISIRPDHIALRLS
jgi:hypothetical protein